MQTTPEEISLLLVEDSATDADLIQESLSNSKDPLIKLRHFPTVMDGLKYLDKETVDVILLDLNLPDADGLAALEGMRRGHPHIPVVVLTGNDNRNLALEAISRGAQDYLVKRIPFPTSEQLVQAIHYAIRRKAAAHRYSQLLTHAENLKLRNTHPKLPDSLADPGMMEQLQAEQDRLEICKDRLHALVLLPEASLPESRLRRVFHAELEEFIKTLSEHFTFEETGYFQTLEKTGTPSMTKGIRKIVADHQHLAQQAQALASNIEQNLLRRVRQQTLDFLCQIVEHEITEALLLRGYSA